MVQLDGGDVLPVERAEPIVWSALETGSLTNLASTALGRAALAAFVLDHQQRLRMRFAKRGVRPHVTRRPEASGTSEDPRDEYRWDRRAEQVFGAYRRNHPDYEQVLRAAISGLGLRPLCDANTERVFLSHAPSLARPSALQRLKEIAIREHTASLTANAG